MSVDPNNAVLINGAWVDKNSEQAKQYFASLNMQATPQGSSSPAEPIKPQQTTQVSQQQTIIDNEAKAGQGNMSDEQWEYVLKNTSKPLVATVGENNGDFTLNVKTGDQAITYNDAMATYTSRYGYAAAENASISELEQAMGKQIGVSVSKSDIEEVADTHKLSTGYTITKAQLAGNGDIGYAYQKGDDITTRLNNDLYSSNNLTELDKFKLNLLVADQRIKDNTMINADLASLANDTNRINLAGTSQNTDAYLVDNPYTHTESIINSKGGIYTGYTDVTGKIFGLKEPFPGANAITGLPYGTTIGGIDVNSLFKQTQPTQNTSLLPNIGLQSGPDNGLRFTDSLNNKVTAAGITGNTSSMMLNNREYSDPLNAMGVFSTGQKISELGSIPMNVAGSVSSMIPGGNIAYSLNYPIFAMQKAGAGMAGGLVMGAGAGIGLAEASIQDAIKGNYTKYDNPTGVLGNTIYVPDTLKAGFSGGILGNPSTIKGEDYTIGTTRRIDYVNENGGIVKTEYEPTTVKVPNEKTIDMPNLGEQLVMGFAPSLFDQKKGYLQVKENLGTQDVLMGVTEAGINTGLILTGVKLGGGAKTPGRISDVYAPGEFKTDVISSTVDTNFKPLDPTSNIKEVYTIEPMGVKNTETGEGLVWNKIDRPKVEDTAPVYYDYTPKKIGKSNDLEVFGSINLGKESIDIGKPVEVNVYKEYTEPNIVKNPITGKDIDSASKTSDEQFISKPVEPYKDILNPEDNGVIGIMRERKGYWQKTYTEDNYLGQIGVNPVDVLFKRNSRILENSELGLKSVKTEYEPRFYTVPAVISGAITSDISNTVSLSYKSEIPGTIKVITPYESITKNRGTIGTTDFDVELPWVQGVRNVGIATQNVMPNFKPQTIVLPDITSSIDVKSTFSKVTPTQNTVLNDVLGTSTRTTNKNNPPPVFGGFDFPSGGGQPGLFGRRGKFGRAYINPMGNPFGSNVKVNKHKSKKSKNNNR